MTSNAGLGYILGVALTIGLVSGIASPAGAQTIFGIEDIVLDAGAHAGNASVGSAVQDPVGTAENASVEAVVEGDWGAHAQAGIYVITFDGVNGAAPRVACQGANVTAGSVPSCGANPNLRVANCYIILGSFVCIL